MVHQSDLWQPQSNPWGIPAVHFNPLRSTLVPAASSRSATAGTEREHVITVDGLTKRYRTVKAVDALSFEVADGELFALLGTNGAGKTTTISCMTTLLGFDAGEIVIDGLTVGRDDHRIRERIGVVFQQSLLDPMLSVDENLRLRARLHGVADSRIDELAELVDLKGFRDRRYGVLSGGQKRRVDIARALINRPQTLFLDEPTAGLDPQSRDQVWRAVSGLQQDLGLTVVLTTHYMQETESADSVIVIDEGRILAEGTPIDLRAEHSQPELLLVAADGQRDDVVDAVERHLPDADWFDEGGAVHVPVPNSATALAVLNDLGDAVSTFQLVQGSMDDVFLRLTNGRESE